MLWWLERGWFGLEGLWARGRRRDRAWLCVRLCLPPGWGVGEGNLPVVAVGLADAACGCGDGVIIVVVVVVVRSCGC